MAKKVVNLGNEDGKMREPDIGQDVVDVRVLEEEGDHVVLVVQLALLHLALRSTECIHTYIHTDRPSRERINYKQLNKIFTLKLSRIL